MVEPVTIHCMVVPALTFLKAKMVPTHYMDQAAKTVSMAGQETIKSQEMLATIISMLESTTTTSMVAQAMTLSKAKMAPTPLMVLLAMTRFTADQGMIT